MNKTPFEITLSEGAFGFDSIENIPLVVTSVPEKTEDGFKYTAGYSEVTDVQFDMSTEEPQAYDLDAIKKYFTEKYSQKLISAQNSRLNKEAAKKNALEKRRARNKFKKTTRKK